MPKPFDELNPIQSGRMSDHLVRLEKLLDHARINNWSDAELARQMGRSQQQLNSWKAGDRKIGEKLARSIEEKLGMRRFALDDRPASALAQRVSESPPRWSGLPPQSIVATRSARSIPVCPWHRLGDVLTMNDANRQDLPHLETFAPASDRSFFLTMNDDSMAPRVLQGDDLLFDPMEAPRAGDLVLISSGSAEHFVRVFRPKTAYLWDAVAANPQYLPFSAPTDDMTVLAVAVEHRSYLRR